ncbi:MAG: Zn-dependent hydrolase [Alphaproteobacteria bacterium]
MNTRLEAIDGGRNFGAKERAAFARDLFDQLRAMSVDGPGVSRDSYGPGEQKAIEHVAAIARDEGLAVAFDAAANLVITLPGADPDAPAIVCGSHLDSVPQGGNFDGAAGVIAGLMALIRMKRAGVVPKRTIKVMSLRGEESAWFGQCYLGSSALFGELAADDLARTHRVTGRTLDDYMKEAGAEIGRIAAGERLLDPECVAAYLELHIEQGPVMVARDMPVAIVTGLRGNFRHLKIVCRGEAGHAGAVPRWLRHDAVLATADLLMRLDEHWRVLLERGLDLVLTAGILSTNPEEHAMSRIPGECTFSLEVRSQSLDTLEAFYQLLRSEADSIGRERGVAFEFDRRSLSRPARMDESWVAHLLDTARTLKLNAEPIPSGAGHDAAVFANAGVPSAMIFVRNEHGSHNPKEAMEISDFLYGADVLYHAILDPPE